MTAPVNDLIILPVSFNDNGYWDKPIPEESPELQELIAGNKCVQLFDQNGYDLCPLEQLYAKYNVVKTVVHRKYTALQVPWVTQPTKFSGYVLNHSMVLERKGYNGAALRQLESLSKDNPLVRKLIHIKPKWGIDVSIDYVDDKDCFELFHYEWDTFDYDNIYKIKANIERLISVTDFNIVARDLAQRKDEWINLDFFQQSDWKCRYFGIPSEKFKMVVWE